MKGFTVFYRSTFGPGFRECYTKEEFRAWLEDKPTTIFAYLISNATGKIEDLFIANGTLS